MNWLKMTGKPLIFSLVNQNSLFFSPHKLNSTTSLWFFCWVCLCVHEVITDKQRTMTYQCKSLSGVTHNSHALVLTSLSVYPWWRKQFLHCEEVFQSSDLCVFHPIDWWYLSTSRHGLLHSATRMRNLEKPAGDFSFLLKLPGTIV